MWINTDYSIHLFFITVYSAPASDGLNYRFVHVLDKRAISLLENFTGRLQTNIAGKQNVHGV